MIQALIKTGQTYRRKTGTIVYVLRIYEESGHPVVDYQHVDYHLDGSPYRYIGVNRCTLRTFARSVKEKCTIEGLK